MWLYCVQTAKLVKFMVASNMQSIFSDFHSSLSLALCVSKGFMKDNKTLSEMLLQG